LSKADNLRQAGILQPLLSNETPLSSHYRLFGTRLCDSAALALVGVTRIDSDLQEQLETWTIQQTYHPNPCVRGDIIHFLFFIGTSRCLPRLRDLLNDEEKCYGFFPIRMQAESVIKIIEKRNGAG
jgi:hypothetical protein